jgi:hypothetical protein
MWPSESRPRRHPFEWVARARWRPASWGVGSAGQPVHPLPGVSCDRVPGNRNRDLWLSTSGSRPHAVATVGAHLAWRQFPEQLVTAVYFDAPTLDAYRDALGAST